MLLESAEALFERMEHRLRQLRRLARFKHELEDYALAKDMASSVRRCAGRPGQDAPVSGHNSWICAGNKKPRQKESRGFPFLCIGAIRAASVEVSAQPFGGGPMIRACARSGRIL